MSFGRLATPRAAPPFGAINITPLVDVVLVLLVVFIVSAPLMAQRLALDLPSAPAPAAPAPPTTLELDVLGQLRLAGDPLDEPALRARLQALATAQPDSELLLRVDERVPYGRVVGLIGLAQAAGLSRIGFVAVPVPAAAHGR